MERHTESTRYIKAPVSECISFHADHFKIHINQIQTAKLRCQAQLCSPVFYVLLLLESDYLSLISEMCPLLLTHHRKPVNFACRNSRQLKWCNFGVRCLTQDHLSQAHLV